MAQVDLETAAGQPRRASADGVSAEQHSLPDQIAADEYLQKRAFRRKSKRVQLSNLFVRLKPPGGA